jgi:hypothetical protein
MPKVFLRPKINGFNYCILEESTTNEENGVLKMRSKLEKERGNMLAKRSENEQKLFQRVYKRHVNAMDSEEWEKGGREIKLKRTLKTFISQMASGLDST